MPQQKDKNFSLGQSRAKKTGALIIFDFQDVNSQNLKSIETIEIPNGPFFIELDMARGGEMGWW